MNFTYETQGAITYLVCELAESDYYKDLNAKLGELTNRVRDIKSVTIGVNLDGTSL